MVIAIAAGFAVFDPFQEGGPVLEKTSSTALYSTHASRWETALGCPRVSTRSRVSPSIR